MILVASFAILLLQTPETRAAAPEMTTGGWLFMGGAWLCILTLVYFTFSKVLRGARK